MSSLKLPIVSSNSQEIFRLGWNLEVFQVDSNLRTIETIEINPLEFDQIEHNQNSRQTSGQFEHSQQTSVIIKAFNYKLRLDLELNDVLFGPNLVQKHIIPKGTHISTHQLDNCYYHAKSSPVQPNSSDTSNQNSDEFTSSSSPPTAIGAFRTCNGLSGIIHVNNESLVIHPFYNADLSKKQPHIIYRYQSNLGRPQDNGQASDSSSPPSASSSLAECSNSLAPNELRQFNSKQLPASASDEPLALDEARSGETPRPKVVSNNSLQEQQDRFRRNQATALPTPPQLPGGLAHLLNKRDVGLVEKYIELGLVLSRDMFTKRNTSSRLEVLHDAIQIINCLDLYFRRSANTRVGIVYIETWAYGDQIEISEDPKQTLYNFLDYSTRHLYATSKDAVHLITGGHSQQFHFNSFGMSIPDSVCTTKAVSVSQEASVLEPFLTAATIAHLIGHNLGMEHDREVQEASTTANGAESSVNQVAPSSGALTRPLPTTTTTEQSAANIFHKNPTNWLSPHQTQSHSDSASSDGLSDEHEEEVKSRSLSSHKQLEANNQPPEQRGGVSNAWQWSDQEHQIDECHSNCIMNERFVFVHSPVALGSMQVQPHQQSGGHSTAVSIQQQSKQVVASTDTFAVRETSISSGHNSLTSGNSSFQAETVEFFDGGGGGSLNQQTSSGNKPPSLPFKFSRASVETYFGLLREGRNYCLWNKPNKLETSIVATCGNGIVEHDEDCDCGSRADCWNDTCCERLTCKFRKGRECISGTCCDRCRFRPRGTLCRRARNECDLAEHCDGNSFACGPDLFKQNGFPCNSGAGYCFMGQCPGHEFQCTELWGPSARQADRLCYSQFNSNGTIVGNCGLVGGRDGASSRLLQMMPHQQQQLQTQRAGVYKRCEPENQLCGTLQCQLGDMKPATAELDGSSPSSSHDFSRKILRHNGREIECKAITRTSGLGHYNHHHYTSPQPAQRNQQKQQQLSMSYVRDGSKCAERKVCFNQTCLALERAYPEPFELCPRNELGHFCSQHGVCSSANKCLCESSWTGDDCSQPNMQQAEQQQPPAMPPPPVIEITAPNYNPAPASQVAINLSNLSSLTGPVDTSGLVNPTAGGVLVSLPASNVSVAATPVPNPPLNVVEPLQTPTSAPLTTTTTTTVATTAAAAQQGTTSSHRTGENKRGGLEDTTLVYILVSGAAAVYLGFALMANCYRHKGLFRPDKVLRHHQMNCKMDALRSSFIAKRLADPEGIETSPSLTNFQEMMPSGSIPNVNSTKPWAPLLSQQPPGSAHYMHEFNSQQQQHLAHQLQQASNLMDDTGQDLDLSNSVPTTLQMTAPSSMAINHQHRPPGPPPPPPPPPPPAHSSKCGQTIQATVHYLEKSKLATGSGDHLPLLANQLDHQHQQSRSMQQPAMSSFNNALTRQTDRVGQHRNGSRQHLHTTANANESAAWPTSMQTFANDHDDGPMHLDNAFGRQLRPSNSFINRTISLGSVHRCSQIVGELYEPAELDDVESQLEGAGGRNEHQTDHCGLATPSRRLRDPRFSGRNRTNSLGHQLRRQSTRDGSHLLRGRGEHFSPEFDSCSAPSSPDGVGHSLGGPFWVHGKRHHHHHHNFNQHPHFVHRPIAVLKQQRSFERHRLNQGDELESSADHSDPSQSRSPSPPAPPPPLDQFNPSLDHKPLPPLPHQGPHNHHHHHHHHHRHRNQLNSNNNQRALNQTPQALDFNLSPADGLNQQPSSSTLIEQLQQLERVQSLHQKQTSGAGLHEFFLLPLSVQLSALLARTLADQTQQSGGVTSGNQRSTDMQIDEYLTTLNNTNVATSSRRSFKGVRAASSRGGRKPSQQQQHVVKSVVNTAQDQQQPVGTATATITTAPQAGSSAANSRGGTMRKQNSVKLQNLQSLISRLQKLHNQTMIQQQQQYGAIDDDLNYDDDGENLADEEATNSETGAETIEQVNCGEELLQLDATDDDGESPATRDQKMVARLVVAANSSKAPAGRRRGNMQRSDSHRAARKPKEQGDKLTLATSRTSLGNELVYSVSDSEDGGEMAFVAARRLIAAATQVANKRPELAIESNDSQQDSDLERQKQVEATTMADNANAGGGVPLKEDNTKENVSS